MVFKTPLAHKNELKYAKCYVIKCGNKTKDLDQSQCDKMRQASALLLWKF